MLFEIPSEITAYVAELDDFIEREIKPIEQRDDNIYRHHRRYRSTEGAEEIPMRNVAGHLFGFMG